MFAEFLEDQLKLIPDHLGETEDDTTACECVSVYRHIISIDFEGHENF
jgi:hypothetical protein